MTTKLITFRVCQFCSSITRPQKTFWTSSHESRFFYYNVSLAFEFTFYLSFCIVPAALAFLHQYFLCICILIVVLTVVLGCVVNVPRSNCTNTGWPKKLHSEMCSRYFSNQRNKQCQTPKIVQIHSETVFSVSSLLLDDTFQPVTPFNAE